jgi:hypothetical protein
MTSYKHPEFRLFLVDLNLTPTCHKMRRAFYVAQRSAHLENYFAVQMEVPFAIALLILEVSRQ